MAEEKVVEAVETAEKPAKKATRKPKAKKEEAPAKASFPAPTAHDYEVIVAPLITEKTMALMQNANKVTVKVAKNSNKVEIKEAFQRIFQVKVTDVKVANQIGKTTTRGGRYKGTISGFKKAVITIAEGEAIDLFKE
jgi:large subunit ribosomal protein L23